MIFRPWLIPLLVISSTIARANDPLSLFDGTTLNGWEGDTAFWSVQDGAITGESTVDRPCKQSTYLAYTPKEFSNFELTLSFRLIADKSGNSGIQYRSRWADREQHQIVGYQADMETGANYSGILYEQGGRGIIARRGQQLHIAPDGTKTVTPLPDADKAQASIKRGDWNHYRIIADGDVLVHEINGFTTIRVEDQQSGKSAERGLIALQLHQGPPMKVQFKDITVRELPHSKTN